ncbi:uncharacterized protein ACIB01_000185 isoform 1-T1 [Guaruba guarouba]
MFVPQPRVGGCCRGGPWAAARPAGRRLLASLGAVDSLARPLEQWGPEPGREGRREYPGERCAALLRDRSSSPPDRRHHAASPLCLPLPRSDGNPGRDVSRAPWDRPAAGGGGGGGATAGGDGQHRRASGVVK